MSVLQIETAVVFEPLLGPSRYKGAHGGRGSGKSQFFGGLMVEDAVTAVGDVGVGLLAVCVREVQRSLEQSSKRLIESKLAEHGLGERHGFKVFKDRIQTPGDGVIIFQGMQDHTAESVKSLEGFRIAWVEEAQSLSAHSLNLLRPTIREPGSQIWASWNPRRKIDPIDVLLRGAERPSDAAIVRANWSDNPWFPPELEQERLDALRIDPDSYAHVWDGEYARILVGAYFAKPMQEARAQNRIGVVSADPLLTIRAFWDIGGTGAKADATAIWIVQFIGSQVRVLDYYEAQGQPLEAHLNWLRDKGYQRAECVLPHDGASSEKVYSVSYQSAMQAAGFNVRVVPNMGAGAASRRVEAVRRVFPSIWMHEATTEAGREALGWYHEKRDEVRGIGLGPNHDWSSHGADAFGLMAVDFLQNTHMPSSSSRRAPPRLSTA